MSRSILSDLEDVFDEMTLLKIRNEMSHVRKWDQHEEPKAGDKMALMEN